MTNSITETIHAGYNASIQSLSHLNQESAANAITAVATTAITALSTIYFYPPNVLPAEVEILNIPIDVDFLNVPIRALIMVPVMLAFVLPVMLGSTQLTYEAVKAGVGKLGRAVCPEHYSAVVHFIQHIDN